ncbi:MAG: ROK family protein [Patescibacteria group bacterium]
MPTKYTIGVDIGATKIVAGLVKGGQIIHRARFLTKPSQKSGKEAILSTLKSAIDEVWDKRVSQIGLGLAGTTDSKKATFFHGANFPASFKNISFDLELQRYQVPICIDNDVHCFTLGEALFGQGKNYQNVFGLTLGTGVGGALVIDKKIFRGRNNAAGEIGHTIISMTDRQAICGQGFFGHLESYASGSGISRMIAEQYNRPFSPEELEKLAKAGDAKAKNIYSLAGHAFAVGCANVVQTINPDVIVVGGGLARAQDLWRVLRREFRGLITYPELRSTPIVKSKLLHDANILGAANLKI